MNDNGLSSKYSARSLDNMTHAKRLHELFADAVVGAAESGMLIWIHGYHLMSHVVARASPRPTQLQGS
ncbi:hypothetical protein N7461_003002 [Penicillium sp. DV-2018c]|nr:hypothetical protein N7461_003002 [Penicillium sp. DV-2018c]